MVGIVIAGHARLSSGLLGAARAIMKVKHGVLALPYRRTESMEEFAQRLRAAIYAVEAGQGVLVLTDMYGDTPTNAALQLTRELGIEVVAGVNLPMLLEALTHRHEMPLAQLAKKAEQRSRQCIVNAGAYSRCHRASH